MAQHKTKRLAISLIGALAVAGLAGTAGFAATSGRAQNAPATPTPTAVATLPPSTVAAPAVVPPAPAPVEAPMAVPFGPLAADPYRVRTGDGDCLNVRPVPGTTFASDPRTCVPEGFLLWLYGEPQQADGHTWRYALGEGWVAMQYVVPAQGVESGFGPFQAVTVGARAGEVTKLARVSKDGRVTPLPTLPDVMQGLGDQPPLRSPDGRWAAYGREKGYVPTLTLRDMRSGAERDFPQANPREWSPSGDRLLVYANANCPLQCARFPAWLDPETGAIRPLAEPNKDWWATTWAPDGESLYVVEQGTLIEVGLDGSRRVILGQDAGVGYGQIAVSEDGRKLVSSPFQGTINIIDLETGAVSRVQRAPQIPVGGKCGGSIGSLTTWLDERTVIWHESYAEKGGNGITISRIDGSMRKLIPFFTVSDIRKVAPGLVSFTTWEDPKNGGAFQLTWLLDTETGEARPVTVGATPAWE